tara:strand:- start:987 stop:1829 length:843 start_codon:yes stop_codon:yes gene_type:complete
MAQRIMQYQAALQLAVQAPQMYDLPLLHRQMLEVLGIRDADKIVPLEDETQVTDPVTENMNIINGKPVKAFIFQDHEAHIQTHVSLIEDPKIIEIMSQSPTAKVSEAAMASHISEHVAFAYRAKIEEELGVPLPSPEEKLPEDIELRLSRLVAPAAAQLTGKDQREAQMQKQMEESEDPIIQMQQQELQIKQRQVEAKAQSDMAKIELDLKKSMDKSGLDRDKLETQERIETAKLGARIAADNSREQLESKKIASKEQVEGAKLGRDIAKDLMGNKNSDG